MSLKIYQQSTKQKDLRERTSSPDDDGVDKIWEWSWKEEESRCNANDSML